MLKQVQHDGVWGVMPRLKTGTLAEILQQAGVTPDELMGTVK
jgi:hypothetical protein